MHLSPADTDVWDSALVPSVLVQAGETGLALGDRRHSLFHRCSLPYSLTLLLLAILSIYRSFPTSVTEELWWWWSSPLFALSLLLPFLLHFSTADEDDLHTARRLLSEQPRYVISLRTSQTVFAPRWLSDCHQFSFTCVESSSSRPELALPFRWQL